MMELFEFEVYKDQIVSDLYIEQFIEEFLDKHSLFWGGGYDFNKINGVISTYEENVKNINSIISDFVNYFSEQDKIIINVYSQLFREIDLNILSNNGNLDLKETENVSD